MFTNVNKHTEYYVLTITFIHGVEEKFSITYVSSFYVSLYVFIFGQKFFRAYVKMNQNKAYLSYLILSYLILSYLIQ